MKKIYITTLFLFIIQLIAIAQDADFDKTRYSKELSQRFLKLGNTYREAQNYDKANYYLTKGINLAKKYHQSYWIAVGYEYHGYLQRDIGNNESAKEFLLQAKSIYDKIIRQSDGSKSVIDEVINSLGEKRETSNQSQKEELLELKKENKLIKISNEEYLSKITTLEGEIKSLKEQLSQKNNKTNQATVIDKAKDIKIITPSIITKPKAETKPDTKTETKAETKPETKLEKKAETKSAVKTETKPETKSVEKPETKTETKAEIKATAKPETKPEIKATAKPETKPEKKAETISAVKPETKTEIKSEIKAPGKPEIKAETKSVEKPETKTETKAEIKAEIKADSKPKTIKGKLNEGNNDSSNFQPDNNLNISEIETALKKLFIKEIPVSWVGYMGGIEGEIISFKIIQQGKYNIDRKYWLLKIHVKGKCKLTDPFHKNQIVDFNNTDNFIFFRDENEDLKAEFQEGYILKNNDE